MDRGVRVDENGRISVWRGRIRGGTGSSRWRLNLDGGEEREGGRSEK